MTIEEIESELEKLPFVPFRLHLVSGKTLDVMRASAAAMLTDALMVFHIPTTPGQDVGYDLVGLRNIERLEQIDP